MGKYYLTVAFGIAFAIWGFWYDKNKFQPTTKNNGKVTKPIHTRWWYWVIVVVTIGGGLGNIFGITDDDDDDDYSDDAPQTEQVKKVNHSKNLPGQKINPYKAKKHEFYWTSKDDKKVRYFVDDDKKITAIKVVLTPEVNNTWWCQAYMEKVLHDDNLKYGSDKQNKDDSVLSNKVKYNIYSPKYKKWYWVNFAAADGKNMVASFSIYPGKSSEAE